MPKKGSGVSGSTMKKEEKREKGNEAAAVRAALARHPPVGEDETDEVLEDYKQHAKQLYAQGGIPAVAAGLGIGALEPAVADAEALGQIFPPAGFPPPAPPGFFQGHRRRRFQKPAYFQPPS